MFHMLQAMRECKSTSSGDNGSWECALDAVEGWPLVDAIIGVEEQMWGVWEKVRVGMVAPFLRICIALCLAMTVMTLAEKLVKGAVSLAVNVFLSMKPERRYKWKPIRPDMENGNLAYPMVLVQIPMYNEKEVYKLSISAVCNLDWPRERLVVQVLDDSKDPVLKDLVELECKKWESKGVDIHYIVRDNRNGYKAGALKEGMEHHYVRSCDYVALFDADFQPDPDFLVRTVPFLIHNPEIALVQARWKFVNADECMLTRLQEMSLDYHFKVEQEAGSFMFSFFGFNGTAGVWRIAALNDAGGWKDRTTVEDMDLAVRAGLQGWKFVYAGDMKVKSELPSTFKAYRLQQHRWACGPANLFKKMAVEILLNKKVSIWKRLYIFSSFFFVDKIVAHTVSFIFFCVLIPMSILVPEAKIPLWGVFHVPTLITLCKSVGTPSSMHLLVFWSLFENVMSFHRIKAAMIGLLEAERVNEWVVTQKFGAAFKMKLIHHKEAAIRDIDHPIIGKTNAVVVPKALEKIKTRRRIWHRFHYSEIGIGVFLAYSAVYDIVYRKTGYFIYLFLQAIAFFIVGFDNVGTSVST